MFAQLKNNIETINGNSDTKNTLNSICDMIEELDKMSQEISNIKNVVDDTHSVAQTILSTMEDQNQKERNLIKSRLLVPFTFEADLKRHSDKFVEGTRQWVFDNLESWRKDLNGRRC